MKGKTFGRKKVRASAVVDITSLLDILVILLVFLLSAYSASDLNLKLIDNLAMPNSRSRGIASAGLVLQVDANREIWFNDESIGFVPARIRKGEGIDQLYQLLSEKKVEYIKNGLYKRDKQINLVLDQALPYEVLQKIMHTSALAGFSEFKFIVKSGY